MSSSTVIRLSVNGNEKLCSLSFGAPQIAYLGGAGKIGLCVLLFCLFLLIFMDMFVVVMPLGADRFCSRVMVDLVPFINVMFKISIKKIVEKTNFSTNLLNQ